MDFLLIPLHINNNHWMMMVIYMKHKHIAIYDSLVKSEENIDKICQPYTTIFEVGFLSGGILYECLIHHFIIA
jgi:hypothetical protein